MKHASASLILVLALGFGLVPQARAQDGTPPPSQMQDGLNLLGEGARQLLDGLIGQISPGIDSLGNSLSQVRPMIDDLLTRIGDIRNYEMPTTLPNGDILIRRKPDAPPYHAPEAPPPPSPIPGITLPMDGPEL